jgi:hypothetical protein
MFAYRSHIFKGLFGFVVLLAALVAFGCGSDSGESAPATGGSQDSAAAEPDVGDADPEEVDVISGWIEALSEGDVERAAGYFAVPGTAQNGPLLVRIRDTGDAVAFNESLPCGGELVSAETVGDFTTATFELTERPGGGCGPGTGGTASTSFVIEDGKIAEWRRVDEGGPPPGSSAETVSAAQEASFALTRLAISRQTSVVPERPPRSGVLIPAPAASSVAS